MELEANFQEIVIRNKNGNEFKILGTIFDYYIISVQNNLYTVTSDCLDELLSPGETMEHIKQGVEKQINHMITNEILVRSMSELVYLINEYNENNDEE